MTLELTDWDNDLPSETDEEYQALVRTLKFTEGFGLFFVRCSPAESEQIITKIKVDVANKNIHVLRLDEAVNNLYEIIEKLDNREKIEILFITGLEHSFYKYEECKALAGWNSRDIYSYSWKGVPPVLINLNQQRERFRDNFNMCFVFLLPQFAIKYFIQRAPDFFDWRSGLFEFPLDQETLEQESLRHSLVDDYEIYLKLTPEERTQKIIEIQELIVEYHQTPDQRCSLLISLGRLQSAGKDYIQALASYDKALAIQPDKHEAWNKRGNALSDLGRYEEASVCFDKALEIQLDDHKALYNRGNAVRQLGCNEEAIAAYERALAIQPDDHYAWNLQGYALSILGRNEEAIAAYERALVIQPNDHYAWFFRGNAFRQLGRNEEAIAAYDRVLAIQPDDHYAWYIRGNALRQLKRNEEAIAAYDKALAIQPDFYQAWYNKACSYAKLGNIEQALENLQKAIDLSHDRYIEMARTDSDFDGIREDERFQTLMQAGEFEAF
ncbi:tetratricopeptide repeat protein [Nostoc sp. CCY0012]|uniref:tetratricopeptide repeat protein n=1 Tax=Nostoc sp. CCY0012 TaxID=1056123 RepID=UPI0039C6CC6F